MAISFSGAVKFPFWSERRFLLVLLSASAVLNGLLAWELRRAISASAPPPFLTGNVAPRIRMTNSESPDITELRYDQGTPTLLYRFSPSCGWCETNLANFKALAMQAPGKYRFLPVSAASVVDLQAYAAQRGLQLPLMNISPQAAKLYRLQGTPTSLLISKDGALLRKWVGAYSPRVLTEIESALSIQLPGLTAVNKKE